MSACEVDRLRVARVEVAAGVDVVAVRVVDAVQGGASSSGASAVRLSGAWWLKRTTSSSAAVAASSWPRSHLNWGSSMLPSEVELPVGVTIVPASATVSRAMKRIPGVGLQA